MQSDLIKPVPYRDLNHITGLNIRETELIRVDECCALAGLRKYV